MAIRNFVRSYPEGNARKTHASFHSIKCHLPLMCFGISDFSVVRFFRIIFQLHFRIYFFFSLPIDKIIFSYKTRGLSYCAPRWFFSLFTPSLINSFASSLCNSFYHLPCRNEWKKKKKSKITQNRCAINVRLFFLFLSSMEFIKWKTSLLILLQYTI